MNSSKKKRKPHANGVLRLKPLAEYLNVSEVTIWRWRNGENDFPEPLYLNGTRMVAWLESDIEEWLAAC